MMTDFELSCGINENEYGPEIKISLKLIIHKKKQHQI